MTSPDRSRLKVAYLLHRFPYHTETFIVREMHGLMEQGVDLSIYSMMAPESGSASDQGDRLLDVANYAPRVSATVLTANLIMLITRPVRYVRAFARLLARTWREPLVLALMVSLFPKTVLFARQIERRGVQHMHAHFVWIEGLAAGVVRDLTGIPFTIQPHAFGLFGRNRTNVRLELADATGIVTISEYNRRFITDLDPALEPKIDVVHCGVDMDRFPPPPERPATDIPRILSIGRAVEKKGHDHLIDACAILRDRNVAFRCDLVVGADEASAELQRRIDRHRLGDRVRLHDFVDEPGVIRYLHEADVFALACVVASSGDRDGIPVATMEAMACELPVVSTTVSGVPELVRDGAGLLTPPGDAAAMADALERLIRSPEDRLEMGRRGRQIVMEEFQAADGAARMRELFTRYRRSDPRTGPSGRKLRILMLLENSPYPQDDRVRREATTLVKAGHAVTVVAPSRGQPVGVSRVDGVRVLRHPMPPERDGLLGYITEYGSSLMASLFLSLYAAVRGGFDVIHAHNPPDLFVLIALLYRPFGKRFVFDHHDLSPEMYDARFGDHASPVVRRVLRWFERLTFGMADHVISTNESYRAVAIGRGRRDPSRVTVVRNGPDLERIKPVAADPSLHETASTLIGYVGEMNNQDGVDYLIRALHRLQADLGVDDFQAVVIGRGSAVPELEKLAAELGLADKVHFPGFVSDDDLLRYLSSADICAVPDPRNDFTDRSTMIKIMEYMALGRPVVAFDLTEHRRSAGDAAVYATPNDELDFARKIADLIDDPDRRAEMGEIGRRMVEERLAWRHQEGNLIDVYAGLAAR